MRIKNGMRNFFEVLTSVLLYNSLKYHLIQSTLYLLWLNASSQPWQNESQLQTRATQQRRMAKAHQVDIICHNQENNSTLHY